MLKRMFHFLILSISIACGQGTNAGYSNLDALNFEKQIKTPGIVLLDVRSPEEYNSGHLKGAINYNYNGTDFEKQINTIDKTKPVYVYCQRGGRSAGASEVLVKKGFKNVYNLTGGIEAWNGKKLPVTNETPNK